MAGLEGTARQPEPARVKRGPRDEGRAQQHGLRHATHSKNKVAFFDGADYEKGARAGYLAGPKLKDGGAQTDKYS